MKQWLVTIALIAIGNDLFAQLVFRNVGLDTLTLSVAMYESDAAKCLVNRGYYILYPGDSLLPGELTGPAVYYRCSFPRLHITKWPIYGDSITESYTGSKKDYREILGEPKVFNSKKPFVYSNCRVANYDFVFGENKAIKIPSEARRPKRLVVSLYRLDRKG